LLNIRHSGSSIADVIAAVRDVPARVIPYAASTALTRTAKTAQGELIAGMRAGFDRPTAYTLNATFIEPANKEKLSARVAIKNTAGAGTVPEHFLFPEVEGGGRREKRFESALRLAGLMRAGERAMPGAGAARDAYGNLAGGTLRAIFGASKSSRSRIFVGPVGRRQTRGVWQREGRRLKPLLIFTTRLPNYGVRLGFQPIVERVAERDFRSEFYKAAATIKLRNPA
jgi:hypothetical protein